MKKYLLFLLVFFSSLIYGQTPSIKIEAEAFSSHFGLVNEATKDTGGGQNVGNLNTNDWAYYEKHEIEVLEAGQYLFEMRYASRSSLNEVQFFIDVRKTLIVTFVPENTGDYQVWRSATATITLPAGKHKLYMLVTKRVGDGTNFNWYSIIHPSNKPTLKLNTVAVSSSSVSSVTSSLPTSSRAASLASSSSTSSIDPNRPNRKVIQAGGKYYICAYWQRPVKRANGQVLTSAEISGYEIIIRDWYTQKRKHEVIIKHPQLFYEALLPFDYSGDSVRIAVFDINGFYSDFVEIKDQKPLPKPGCYSPVVTPTNLKLK